MVQVGLWPALVLVATSQCAAAAHWKTKTVAACQPAWRASLRELGQPGYPVLEICVLGLAISMISNPLSDDDAMRLVPEHHTILAPRAFLALAFLATLEVRRLDLSLIHI